MGYKIVGKNWSDDLCTWTFEDSGKLRGTVYDYFHQQAWVDPKEYFTKVTEFKRMMYADKPKSD